MAQLLKLRLVERNDTTVEVAATRSGQPIVLDDSAELEMYLKITEYQDDGDAVRLSTTGGQITVVDADLGLAEATVDGSLITTDLTWWHVDVLESGARHTLLRGPVEVVAT